MRDAETVQKQLTVILGRMISVLDTKSWDEYKESFYHGLLLGLLRSEPEWLIRSNRESGDGILAYGIAFCRKRCMVVCERL